MAYTVNVIIAAELRYYEFTPFGWQVGLPGSQKKMTKLSFFGSYRAETRNLSLWEHYGGLGFVVFEKRHL